MSQTYKADGAAKRYDSARALPTETCDLWMAALASALPSGFTPGVVVDLGAGTGRFVPLLQKALGCKVVAVEPVDAMRNEGVSRQYPSVEWHSGTAEAIPLPDRSADLVWMSQVFHHLDDPSTAVGEIRRVLKPGACVAVRNGTKENNSEIDWILCFPEAARIDDARLPRHQDVIEAFTARGFTKLAARTVRQRFASSYSEYYDKIGQRGLSALIAISDEAFVAGLARLRVWVERQDPNAAVYEPVDLFVFRVDAGQ